MEHFQNAVTKQDNFVVQIGQFAMGIHNNDIIHHRPIRSHQSKHGTIYIMWKHNNLANSIVRDLKDSYHTFPFAGTNTQSKNRNLLDFFLNECHWIQRIMTKSKNSINNTSFAYLHIVTFPVIIIESTFYLLPLGRYLLPLTTLSR